MKTFNYTFRSIKSELIEKENRATEKSVFKLEFDKNSIEKHQVQLTYRQIFTHKSWITNLFVSLMLMVPITAFMYAAMKLGLQIEFRSYNVFIIINFFLLFLIWISISIPSSIKNLKHEYIINLRGKGNWKIIDEEKWDKFYRLLNITKNENQS